MKYEWNEAAGRAGFDKAQRVIDLANQHPSGRLMGMVCPSQIDTCSADLLRDAYDLAEERNLPWQTHAAQSVTEFQEMIRRHGKTPVQWMKDIGVLGEHTIIGHGIFLDHHPWVHWSTRKDLDLLADNSVTVAHCPTVFLRRGITLRTFGGYLRHGINMGIGTDTYPHNYLEEMRNVGTVARVIAETVDDLNTSDIFNAATIGGANALRREDLGRLAVGAKADVVMVDLKAPSMVPVREPIRSLVFVAGDRAVSDVFVGGEQVVRDGEVISIDMPAALEALQEAQARSMANIPDLTGRAARRTSCHRWCSRPGRNAPFSGSGSGSGSEEAGDAVAGRAEDVDDQRPADQIQQHGEAEDRRRHQQHEIDRRPGGVPPAGDLHASKGRGLLPFSEHEGSVLVSAPSVHPGGEAYQALRRIAMARSLSR